jgi:DNA invertase Pin-like site-specific DNA recombinase
VPVLVSAIASRPDWFLTYDSHFTPALARRTGLRFATPAEFFRALSLSISSPGAEWNAEWNRDTEPCIEPAGSGRSARAAAVYIFVSKQEEAGSGASLDAQRKRIEGYLKASGLHARMPLVETGASGAEPLEQRTWGMGLFDLIGKGKVRHVVAMNVGSLFRSARDMVTTIAKWDKAGVVLHVMDFCGQTMNTGSPAGRMLLSMANTLLELDRSRITRAIASRKRIGGVYGPMPYGYRKYAGNLFPERMESIALEHMRRLRAEGLSLNAIVRFLHEVEAPSKRGGKWYPTTVKKILARQITLPGDPWLES